MSKQNIAGGGVEPGAVPSVQGAFDKDFPLSSEPSICLETGRLRGTWGYEQDFSLGSMFGLWQLLRQVDNKDWYQDLAEPCRELGGEQ